MNTLKDIPYTNSGHERHILDIHLPESDEFDVLIYFHGGGLENGAKGEIDDHVKTLTDAGIAVVTANYRLYPEAKFPDFIEDCAEVVAWTFANIGKYGKYNKVFIAGTSAGAYISMMLCFDTRYLKAKNIDPMQIAGYIHNGGQPTSHFNVLREKGLDTRRVIIDETSPIYFIGMEEKYPPMIALVADFDMPGRYEQLRLMESAMRDFGYNDFRLRILQGGHCCYANVKLGTVIKDFIGEN